MKTELRENEQIIKSGAANLQKTLKQSAADYI